MDIKILQWNINGFSNNLHELQLLIHDNSPDIIALQETHHNTNPIKINGYVSVVSTSTTGRCSGTAIFFKNNLKHSILNISNFYVAMIIHFDIKIKIISLYLNPSEPLPSAELSSILSCNSPNTIVLGDFNSHSSP